MDVLWDSIISCLLSWFWMNYDGNGSERNFRKKKFEWLKLVLLLREGEKKRKEIFHCWTVLLNKVSYMRKHSNGTTRFFVSSKTLKFEFRRCICWNELSFKFHTLWFAKKKEQIIGCAITIFIWIGIHGNENCRTFWAQSLTTVDKNEKKKTNKKEQTNWPRSMKFIIKKHSLLLIFFPFWDFLTKREIKDFYSVTHTLNIYSKLIRPSWSKLFLNTKPFCIVFALHRKIWDWIVPIDITTGDYACFIGIVSIFRNQR